MLDIVPNHCSSDHPWFRAALADGPGSAARARFHFADGRGPHGDEPPNNWRAMFGGPAWSRVTEPDGTPGQWYLHLFTPEQPDWNWRDSEVAESFDHALRFWLDRGIDGFRIDVAAGLFKHPELPDSPDPGIDERTRDSVNPLAWNQPEVHDVWRRWRAVCEEYTARDGHDRLLVGEVSVPTAAEHARYVRARRAAPGLLLRPAQRPLARRRLPQDHHRGDAATSPAPAPPSPGSSTTTTRSAR